MCGGAGGVRREAFHMDASAHHVLGHACAGAALDDHGRQLVHARRVVARVALHRNLHRGVQADREVVRAVRVGDDDFAACKLVSRLVQELVQLAHRLRRQIERHLFDHAFHTYISSGAGSNTWAWLMPGRCASARNSLAMAT